MASEEAVALVPRVMNVGPYRYEVIFDRELAYDWAHLGTTLFRSKRPSPLVGAEPVTA